MHVDGASNVYPYSCSRTRGGQDDTPGYWFVKFRDGQQRYVPQIRLWNGYGAGLSGACVRFSTNGTKPSTTVHDYDAHCTHSDAQLPDLIDSNSGPGTGTVVEINMNITGMMFISNTAGDNPSDPWVMSLCGIDIYK